MMDCSVYFFIRTHKTVIFQHIMFTEVTGNLFRVGSNATDEYKL